LVNAAAVAMPATVSERALAAVPGVKYVEPDVIVQALAKKTPTPPPQPVEVVQWGVERVNADLVWPENTGDVIKVAVLDSGVDLSHPDLLENLKGGFSAVGYTRSYKDDNGHGTHVAGIIAALDNEIGVVGVANGVDLYAVKVLDRRGSGYLSDIIEGLEWAITNDMDVVNMSLGTSTYVGVFDDAVQKVVNAGIIVVAAAGNDGPAENSVDYPGAFNGVIAVAATSSNDEVAAWSSRGPQVDLAAPGVGIYSTYKGSAYATMSGTSMASPHVAGVVALLLGTADPDGNGWDPGEVEARLKNSALGLGMATDYGSGLVQADGALAPQ
jgi:subtilisin family serine protease